MSNIFLSRSGPLWLTTAVFTVVVSSCFPKLPDEPEDTLVERDSADTVPSPDTDGHSADSTELLPVCTRDADCEHLSAGCSQGHCGTHGRCELRARDGAPCDDEDPCTHSDVCVGSECTGTHYNCDASQECVVNSCDGHGGCSAEVVEGNCLIAGACFAVGEANPANICERCQAGAQDRWSPFDGRNCDDGDTCTTIDQCSNGVCVGRGVPDDTAFDWVFRMDGVDTGERWQVRALVSNKALYQGRTGFRVYQGSVFSWEVRDVSIGHAEPDEQLRLIGAERQSIWLSTHCDREILHRGTVLSMPASPAQHPWCLLELDLDGNIIQLKRLVANPRLRLTDGAMISIDSGVLRRFTSNGSVLWERPYGGQLTDITETDEGELYATLFGSPGSEPPGAEPSFGVFSDITGTLLLVRIDPSGTARWARRVYTHREHDFRFDRSSLAAHPSGDVTIAGSLCVPSQTTFGEAGDETNYSPRGLFSYDPPEVGAGCDGYLVRYTVDGHVAYRWFLTPSATGANFVDVTAVGEDTIAAGRYDEQALLQSASDLKLLTVAGTGFDRPGSVFFGLTPDGELRWTRGHRGTVFGLTRSEGFPGMATTIRTCDGDVGFGSDTQIPNIADCGIFSVGFNTAGGLECVGGD